VARNLGAGMRPVQYERVDCRGGLDLLTPILNLPPGVAREAQNFEISITGGYARVSGYERYDGHASPTSAFFSTLLLTTVGALSAGTAVNGQTSGATATCCGVNPGAVGNVAGFSAITGTFQAGENLRVGSTVIAVITSLNPAITDPYTSALFTEGAANVSRGNISAVPGSGPVRAVFFLAGTWFAMRDNGGGTITNLYKASGTGWTQVPYGSELLYTGGTGTQPTIGQTVTGATSGATGVIAAVINQTGVVVAGVPTWSPSTGRFIFSSTTGTFVNAEVLKVSGAAVATSSGGQVAIAPNPGGTFTIDTGAFGGTPSGQTMIWGASGVDRGFGFDGTTYIPVTTGAVPDTPTIARRHLQYLVLVVKNNVQISGLGLPFQWSPTVGAATIVLPENCTNVIPLPGNQATGALALFTQNFTQILYGQTTATFQLVPYNIKTGAYFNTAANLSDVYVFETRGIASMTTTLNYGNFDPAYLTMNIMPFISANRSSATCAIVNRSKSQYRIFFSNGYGLYATFLNKPYQGSMPVFFPNPAMCIGDGVDAGGNQIIMFGSNNGFVYQMDIGTSFDGAAISAYMQLVFDSIRSPRLRKRWRHASLEVNATSYVSLGVAYQLSYGQSTTGQGPTANYQSPAAPDFWDSFTWDNFTWDGISLAPIEIGLTGTAENLSLFISCNTDLSFPFTINTAMLHYSIGRGLR
jgi:hypothetical protein